MWKDPGEDSCAQRPSDIKSGMCHGAEMAMLTVPSRPCHQQSTDARRAKWLDHPTPVCPDSRSAGTGLAGSWLRWRVRPACCGALTMRPPATRQQVCKGGTTSLHCTRTSGTYPSLDIPSGPSVGLQGRQRRPPQSPAVTALLDTTRKLLNHTASCALSNTGLGNQNLILLLADNATATPLTGSLGRSGMMRRWDPRTAAGFLPAWWRKPPPQV